MHREQGTRRDRRYTASELSPAQSAVVLVGEVARDHNRIDALLSANVIVILLPSLQTAHSLLPPGEERTPAAAPSHPTATVGNLRIDLTEHRVLWGRRELSVSERELAMLATLSEEPGRARTFAELDELEGSKWLGDTERVRSAIKRLRKKLAKAGVEARIESVRGYGFRLGSRAIDPPASISGGSTGPSGGVIASRGMASPGEPVQTDRRRCRPVAVLFHAVSPLEILWRVGRALPRLPWRAHHTDVTAPTRPYFSQPEPADRRMPVQVGSG